MQLVTVALICEKFKVNGSVSRKIVRDLLGKKLLDVVGDTHSAFTVYSGSQHKQAAAEAAAKAATGGKGKGK
jgi:ribosomal protein S25